MKPSLMIVIALFFVSFPVQAADLSLENCAAINNPDERLACYDTLAGRLPADTAREDSPAPGPVDPVATDVAVPAVPDVAPPAPAVVPAPDAVAIFGLEHKQKPEEDRPDELQLKWIKKKKNAYGKWIVTMENGQVWRQTDSDSFSFRNPEQWVIVSRGGIGSYFLKEPDRKKRIRVERIK